MTVTKKFISFFVIAMMAFSTMAVVAADEPDEPASLLNLTVFMDYDTSTLTVTAHSDADYRQLISLVIYDAAIAEPEISDYVRISEKETDDAGDSVFTFVLQNDIDSKEYVISAAGSGYQAEQCQDTETLKILKKEDADAVLNDINQATEENIGRLLEENAEVFHIDFGPEYEENKEQIQETFLGIRDADYNGAFTTFADMRGALEVVNSILVFNTANTSDQVQTVLENGAATFNIDVTDAYYVAHAADVCEMFLTLSKSLNDGEGIKGITEVKETFEQSIALTFLNNESVDEIVENLEKYATVLGIEDQMETFNDADTDKTKVCRQISKKDFKSVEAARDAFISALEGAPSKPNGSNGGSSGGNSRPSGGSSSGGSSGNTVISGNPQIPTPDPAPAISFSDLDQVAWAAESIQALAEKDIINGYEDGTFRGNDSVKREEFIKMLVLSFDLLDNNSECAFDDVSKDGWYYTYLASAVNAGIVQGMEDGTAGIGLTMTRQDLAVMVFRVMNELGITVESAGTQTAFTDDADIAEYARESVTALQQAGILSGFEDGSFHPAEAVSRAQAAKVLDAVMQLQ